MEFVTKVVECVNTFLWDYALLILLLGAGIIYSFSLKFIQVRKFGAGMKALFGNFSLHGGKGENGLSSFQALTTAIAAQVGTGNIAEQQQRLHPEGRVPSSGCGSVHSSEWLPSMRKLLWHSIQENWKTDTM